MSESQALTEFKQSFPVITEIKIAWGEMDAFQHVNNVSYIRYFESARIAYLEALGHEATISSNTVGPILADISARYRRPVVYPDTLVVGTRVTELEEFGFTMEYQAFSLQQQTVTTLGRSRIVMIDYSSGQKVALKDCILEDIVKLQPELAGA